MRDACRQSLRGLTASLLTAIQRIRLAPTLWRFLARAHGIPFYIAAPSSTFDLAIESGDQIPIEERCSTEITNGFGRQTAPDGVDVYNPAFDVTPAEYIQAIITETGVINPVNRETIERVLGVV